MAPALSKEQPEKAPQGPVVIIRAVVHAEGQGRKIRHRNIAQAGFPHPGNIRIKGIPESRLDQCQDALNIFTEIASPVGEGGGNLSVDAQHCLRNPVGRTRNESAPQEIPGQRAGRGQGMIGSADTYDRTGKQFSVREDCFFAV